MIDQFLQDMGRYMYEILSFRNPGKTATYVIVFIVTECLILAVSKRKGTKSGNENSPDTL